MKSFFNHMKVFHMGQQQVTPKLLEQGWWWQQMMLKLQGMLLKYDLLSDLWHQPMLDF